MFSGFELDFVGYHPRGCFLLAAAVANLWVRELARSNELALEDLEQARQAPGEVPFFEFLRPVVKETPEEIIEGLLQTGLVKKAKAKVRRQPRRERSLLSKSDFSKRPPNIFFKDRRLAGRK